MSDALIDDLLDAYVPPVDHLPQWDVVVRRARRSRRRIALAVAAALVLIVVPAALAVGEGWIVGKPAPPEIKQRFREFDAQMNAMYAAAAKRGLQRKAPLAVATKAYGVLALDTPDGPAYIWAAPERTGRGVCSLMQVYVHRYKRPVELATCDDGSPRKLESGVYGGEVFPSENFVTGRARGGARSVRVELSDGSRLRLPVQRTFFLAQIPKHTHPVHTISYDAAGRVVARLDRK